MSTLATFRSDVAAIIGLDNTTSGDQGLIDGWVNEGYEDVLLRTHCMVQSATSTVTVGQSDYTLDTAILTIIDLYLTSSGTSYRLERIPPAEILDLRIDQASGRPFQYCVNGANLLMLYPTPNTADTLTTYYVPRPTALSTGTDTPSSIPSEQHKLIEYYALARAADYDDDSSSNQGDRYRTLYDNGIKEFRRLIQRKGGSRLAPARLIAWRRVRIPSDPSRTQPW